MGPLRSHGAASYSRRGARSSLDDFRRRRPFYGGFGTADRSCDVTQGADRSNAAECIGVWRFGGGTERASARALWVADYRHVEHMCRIRVATEFECQRSNRTHGTLVLAGLMDRSGSFEENDFNRGVLAAGRAVLSCHLSYARLYKMCVPAPSGHGLPRFGWGFERSERS